MTTAQDSRALSEMELVVLARLPAKKPSAFEELQQAVRDTVAPDRPDEQLAAEVQRTIAGLRARGYMNASELRLESAGRDALTKAVKASRKPSWSQFLASRLTAKLGFDTKASTAHEIGSALLDAYGVKTELAFPQYCDKLIADALGLSERVTLDAIRAHFLGAQLKLPLKTLSKTGLRQAVLRSRPHTASKPPVAPPKTPPAGRPLLEVVRETLPQIGADGRFGPEKVFVSAIWRRLASEKRVVDMSLDHFKRWLINANRNQEIDLARADLVAAMDSKLVADSEIEDKGATFHFVIDRRPGANGRAHAR